MPQLDAVYGRESGIWNAVPATGLLGLLASPAIPRDTLVASLSELPAERTAPLLERIGWHRIDGLAHRAIVRLPRHAAHPWLRASLKRRHERCTAANLVQGIALAEILERLHAGGIPTAVLGGLRSIESIYGDAGSRPVDEHDLLVRSTDRPAVTAALSTAGFAARGCGKFGRGGMSLRLRTEPLQPPAGRGAGTTVFHLPTDRLFRRAAPGRVAGAPVLIPEPVDEMLILAVDIVRQGFDRLIRTADLAHMLAAHGTALDWDRLRERAAASHTLRVLGLALRSAETLGVAADHDALRGAATGRLEGYLLRRAQQRLPLRHGGALLMALSAPRLRDGLRYLFQSMLTADEPGEGSLRPTRSGPPQAAAFSRGGRSMNRRIGRVDHGR